MTGRTASSIEGPRLASIADIFALHRRLFFFAGCPCHSLPPFSGADRAARIASTRAWHSSRTRSEYPSVRPSYASKASATLALSEVNAVLMSMKRLFPVWTAAESTVAFTSCGLGVPFCGRCVARIWNRAKRSEVPSTHRASVRSIVFAASPSVGHSPPPVARSCAIQNSVPPSRLGH